MIIIPIPVAGPIGGPIGIVVSVIITFLGSIFGKGGISKEVAKALEGLRQGMKEMGEQLLDFSWKIAQALAPIFRFAWAIWNKVLKPLFAYLFKLVEKIRMLYERILKPYLDALQKIRKIILDLYEKYVRPIIKIIDTVRQVLYLLKLLHVKFAAELDAKLQEIEGKILAPMYIALQSINQLGGWLNTIMRIDLIMQAGVFLNTVHHYQAHVAGYALEAMTKGSVPYTAPVAPTSAQTVQEAKVYFITGQGDLGRVEAIARASAERVYA